MMMMIFYDIYMDRCIIQCRIHIYISSSILLINLKAYIHYHLYRRFIVKFVRHYLNCKRNAKFWS